MANSKNKKSNKTQNKTRQNNRSTNSQRKNSSNRNVDASTTKFKDCLNDEDNQQYKGKMYNDPTWRKLGSILADQTNAYPLDYIAGTPYIIKPSFPAPKQNDSGVTPHDIITVKINPSFGLSLDRNSAINLAAFKMYTQLSANNNKTTIYQPNDLALILGALGDVISVAAFIRRSIGMAGTVSATNYAYPKAVIEAMGINYSDLIRHLANYRSQYNIIANLSSSILFPADLNYFKTCDALYKDIFLDHSTSRAQTYVTKPATIWRYDDKTFPTGGALVTHNFPENASSTIVTLDVMLDTLRSMIEDLKGTSLLQNVYSDILKLYGGDMAKMVSLPLVPTDYAIAPIYSEEWMVGLENAVVYDGVGLGTENIMSSSGSATIGTALNNVYSNANEGTVIYAPYMTSNSVVARWSNRSKVDITPFCEPCINFHVDSPGIDDKLIAARWIAPCVSKLTNYRAPGIADSAKEPLYQFAFSDHYICGMSYSSSARSNSTVTDAEMLTNYEGELAILAHPRRIIVGSIDVPGEAAESADFTVDPSYIFAEWDVITHVQDTTLKTINECTLLALFNY